ncbi:ABC transporter permease [Deinococcus cellulosilyticus]|uniref:Peptide ABC transporter permease n=1 Tax=Deinococcus cellulosilyticus (strain DSM 18568 / NBRC 106333 / KACC 11606 / 5516J-15) TaxID=1223518 RepID=A0A511MV16_DEIC1|nr:ABC transporter permease [Deinococcus cellulosilyticus]GEM44425.1 peptide ABC transporter permease [Deinococcus cellulosilyticus NBRC 106333 = KACC 11606]
MPYLLRKFLFLLFTLWVAVTLNFILPRLVPGDPIGAMLAKYQGRFTLDSIDALRVAYGLDDKSTPIQQYLTYLWKLLHGDLGRSISLYPTPVSEVLATIAPYTIGLVGFSTVMAFLIGSAMGVYSAWRMGDLIADNLPMLALFLNSMPYFWLALLLLFFLAYKFSFFPLSGALDPFPGAAFSLGWWKSLLWHGALPALTIVVTSAGGWLLTMRNNVISVMSEDYVAFARAKGLPNGRILGRYVLRNALIPSFTGFGMALGFVVGGSVLVEVVFSYPGLGLYLNNAVYALDYPLMQAIFLMIAAAVLIANFVVDLLYSVLDPRVRDGGAA